MAAVTCISDSDGGSRCPSRLPRDRRSSRDTSSKMSPCSTSLIESPKSGHVRCSHGFLNSQGHSRRVQSRGRTRQHPRTQASASTRARRMPVKTPMPVSCDSFFWRLTIRRCKSCRASRIAPLTPLATIHVLFSLARPWEVALSAVEHTRERESQICRER
jgi:hypothetical protein